MPIAIPILIAAGALVVIGGKGSKASKSSKPSKTPEAAWATEPELLPLPHLAPAVSSGMFQPAVDEVYLERDDVVAGDDAGDFETEQEDVSIGKDEEMGSSAFELDETEIRQGKDPKTVCEEFLKAIHVTPDDEFELPINKVAVDLTAIPSMRRVMIGVASNLGRPVDIESVAPQMVRSALADLVPVCEWSYDEENLSFTYNNGEAVTSEIGKDVIYGLMKLSVLLIDEYNASSQTPGAAQ